MPLRFKYRRNKTKLVWEYTTDGIMWRLLPSSDRYFIGEDRNLDTKSVSFFCIYAMSGDILWKNIQLNEKWWVGIEAIRQDILFLHGYSTPDMPEHKKIYALNIRNGKMLWSNEEVKFLFADASSVFGLKDINGRSILLELDINNGEFIKEVEVDDLEIAKQNISTYDKEILTFPKILNQESEDGNYMNVLVKKIIRNSSNGVFIEFIEKPNEYIICYYENLNVINAMPDYRQVIIITSRKNEKILYHDVVNAHSLATHPETFFMIDDLIYYIKERKTLKAVKLSH